MKMYQKLSKDNLFDESCLDRDDSPPNDFISTGIISLNTQISGKIDGGIPVGKITTYAAHKQLGKSIIGKILVKNAQKKGFFPIVIDSEYEWDWDQAEKIGIDCSKEGLVVKQENKIEEIQTYLMNVIKGVPLKERGELFVIIDSWGGLITLEGEKKATEGKATMDNREVLKKNTLVKYMLGTRCTYYITNHLYMNIGGYGDPYRMGGGTKLGYLSHCLLSGKSKTKEIKEVKEETIITGSIVGVKCEKSRCAKEFTEIEYRIKYDGGFDMFYGLMDDAIEGGFVVKTKQGTYSRPHIENDKKIYAKDVYTSDFWLPVFRDTGFKAYYEAKFRMGKLFETNEKFMDDLVAVEKPASKVKSKKEDPETEANTI